MDLEHYNYLIHLLNKVIDENTEVYVAFNHKMIVDFLKNDTDLNIVNIDKDNDKTIEKEGTSLPDNTQVDVEDNDGKDNS